MNRRIFALASVGLAVAAIDGAVLWREIHDNTAAFDARIEEWAHERRSAFDAVVAQVEDAALFHAEVLAADPVIKNTLSAAAREDGSVLSDDAVRAMLTTRLAQHWAIGEERHGLRQLHIHAGPDGTSLLRLHAPAWRSDPTGSVRGMIRDVFVRGLPASGFDVSLTGPSIRGVAPVVPQSGSTSPVLAAVEVGIGFEAVFRRVMETSGGDFAVLLRADAAEQFVADAFRRQAVDSECSCVVSAATQPEITGLLGELPADLFFHSASSDVSVARFKSPLWNLPDRWVAAATWPLSSYGDVGAQVGWVVTWSDVTQPVLAHELQVRSLIVTSAITLVVVSILLWAALRFATQALERVVEQKTRDIEASRSEAVQANLAKSRFLATMSHEMRTPLNGVLGMADILAHTDLDPRQRRMLETIRASGDILLATISDVLDVSKFESGALELEVAPFDMLSIAGRVRDIHFGSAARKGLDLTLTFEGSLFWRAGDPHRMQQILHNLVSNAVKFTEMGAVSVVVDARSPHTIELWVSDTGIGMTADQAARIFEPFTQADASITRKYGGTGLGLSIARSIVDAMKGDVDVSTEPGRGSTFHVRLPLEATAAPPLSRLADEELGPEDLAGIHVLAADDNEVNRAVLTGFLMRYGARVTMCAGGSEAIDAFRSSGPFDIVLLDISMPEVDGLSAMRAIRSIAQDDRRGAPPILACTASTMPDEVAHFLASGFDGLIPKPVAANTLSSALRDALRPGAAVSVAC